MKRSMTALLVLAAILLLAPAAYAGGVALPADEPVADIGAPPVDDGAGKEPVADAPVAPVDDAVADGDGGAVVATETDEQSVIATAVPASTEDSSSEGTSTAEQPACTANCDTDTTCNADCEPHPDPVCTADCTPVDVPACEGADCIPVDEPACDAGACIPIDEPACDAADCLPINGGGRQPYIPTAVGGRSRGSLPFTGIGDVIAPLLLGAVILMGGVLAWRWASFRDAAGAAAASARELVTGSRRMTGYETAMRDLDEGMQQQDWPQLRSA